MTKTFQYSILKYRPSYLLDERVNIGLFFHFRSEQESRYIFTYPPKLKRISYVFPNLGKNNLANIKIYLNGFKCKADNLDSQLLSSDQPLRELLDKEFIVDDANSFFFSDVKQGSFNSVEQTVNYYESQYFKFYEINKITNYKDTAVSDFFKNSLKELANKNDVRLSYFEEDITIENKITSSKFEFRWQNGTSNLIKTLGFDLSDKQDIQDKAFKWTSAINCINKIQENSHYHFDILVARPSNRKLFNAYDKALDVLSDINANKEIVEKEDIKQYAENALSTVKPLSII